jgi:anaphase-promoting complex subunit 1
VTANAFLAGCPKEGQSPKDWRKQYDILPGMAHVESLGIHEPCALQYLIEESSLPKQSSGDSYTWRVYPVYDDEGNEITEEEILQTKNCIVWSRGAIVKRAFNLDIEDEEILHSFVTRFSASPGLDQRQAKATDVFDAEKESIRSSERVSNTLHPDGQPAGQALVIILKTKAHIYFLTGDTHIVSIPFEVQKAFATPQGCLLQRKASTSPAHPTAVSAPQNSFVSQLGSSLLKSQQITLKSASDSRPSLTLSTVARNLTVPPSTHSGSIPSVFSLTDPQAELGVAVTQSRSHATRTDDAQDIELPFDSAEEILYMSRGNEVAASGLLHVEPLLLAVTWNGKSRTFTVWRVRYRDRESHNVTTKRRRLANESHGPRRRSSNMFRVNGSATPVARGPGESRESLGPQLGRSFTEKNLSHHHDEHKTSEVENLATELGPDFADVGVQTRAARRVSSMLARTDLSMGPDRAIVNGYASNNPGRKSLNRVGPRGESIGDFRDRQSFGGRPRSSFPGGSFLSNESSFLDTPVDRLLEGLSTGGDFEGFDNMVLEEATGDLPADVIFSKVHTIPYSNPASITQSSEGWFKIFIMSAPPSQTIASGVVRSISVCIMDVKKGELSVIRMEAMLAPSTTSKRNKSESRAITRKVKLSLNAVNVQRGTNIIDACDIRDGDHCCMLVLTKNREGETSFLLEAVGISSIRIDLPSPLLVHDPLAISPLNQSPRRIEAGRGRVLKGPLPSVTAMENSSVYGQVDVLDHNAQRHRLQIQLQPRHPLVKKVLATLEFALQGKGEGGISITWIEAMRWLRQKGMFERLEWPAMVVTLFSMIVPFLSEKQGKSRLSARQKKAGLLRSSSGAAVGTSRWDEILDEECGFVATMPPWSTGPGWQWILEEREVSLSPVQQQKSKSGISATTQSPFEGRRHVFLVQCVSWAREFMETPVGEQMLGPDGFLPTAPNKDRETRRTAIGSILVALHLLREEQKLDIRSSRSDDNVLELGPVLAQIGHWLNWSSWSFREGSYYYAEIADVDQQLFDESAIISLDLVPQPFVPPSIFEFAEASFSYLKTQPFLTLLDISGNQHSAGTEVLRSRAKSLTPRTLALLKFFSGFSSLQDRRARVEWMWNCGLDAETLGTLPIGISAPFYNAISSCEGSPPSSWSESLLQLIGRDDLKTRPSLSSSNGATTKSHSIVNHEAIRDYHGIGTLVLDTEPSHSWDASSEADRQGVTRLIFREDRRFQDASRLVNQLRAPIAECHPEPDWTEADLLEAQRELVQLITMRTLTVASGRGMMNYSSRVPLLTEKVPIPAFTLQCQVKPSNVTFSADRASFTEDRAVWAFFHNGAAAGLTISRDAKGIDTSWILYNKPPELTNRHAGFLLALGLNGHLKSLAKWVAFKYLTPKHTMTSIGLLLGLSASYLGTMDTLITRLLSVHVTRMLPPGAAELNLSPLTQTTGIMGIGLLYFSSQHRRMSEVMLSEIENNDIEEGVPAEQTLRDEGYRLAAGFALGLINLGQGKKLHALHDMNVMSRLLTIAISTKNVNLVHILDRATSGATIAFALIYMKTNDPTIASKIDIPDTLHQFDYVRPDIFLLRTLARHLIMWDAITPAVDFVRSSLPKAYRHRASLIETRTLNSEDMPFFNILAGLCLALGLRFAGSGSHTARDLLTSYLDQFIRLTRLPALNYDSKLTRNAVRNCQDVTALALAAVMAGTGDLIVCRRLRALHGRQDAETPYGSHLAAHMAIGILFLGGGTYTLGTSDLAVAALLCAFYPVFPTNVMDNQAHLQAFRHLWVLAAEPRCVVARDVETGKPVSLPIVVVLKDDEEDEGEGERHLTAPCLVPELDSIKEIRTEGKGYWDVRVDFSGGEGQKRKEEFKKNHLNIYLRKRAAYDAPKGSVFVSEMQALAEQGPAPSVGLSSAQPINAGATLHGKLNPFEWLWDLEVFRDLDVSERALVLPHALTDLAGSGNRYLRGTVVDTRLELEHGILSDEAGRRKGRGDAIGRVDKDKLWQLRLLFRWVDELDREEMERKEKRASAALKEEDGMENGDKEGEGDKDEGGGNWLRRDVIEKLRWRVWKMGAGVEDENEDVDGLGEGGT